MFSDIILSFLYHALIVLASILITTVTQKYYFLVLQKTKAIHPIFSRIFGFIIRTGIIIHELCHAFFCIISGNKIQEIHLFEETGWRVVIESKDYIGDLPIHGGTPGYFFSLILNQIGLFLISFWPLFFGVAMTFLVFQYLWVSDITTIESIPITPQSIGIIVLYSIILPSFALSIEDVKKFFLSPQESSLATIVGSGINLLVFFVFLLVFSYFFSSYFFFFTTIFLIMFLLQIVVYGMILVVRKISDPFRAK